MLFACMDQAFDMIAVFKLFLYNYTTCHFFYIVSSEDSEAWNKFVHLLH